MLHHLPSITNWQHNHSEALQTEAVTALEQGQVLFMPSLPFTLTEQERVFLTPALSNGKTKNISWSTQSQQLQGTHLSNNQQLKDLLQRFSEHAQTLLRQLFPCYKHALQIGRTSFRPVETAGRKLSYKKDDTRLHVDAFPANPNQGKRILRVFSNINPQGKPRVWRLGEPFHKVVEYFLPRLKQPWPGSAALLHYLKVTKTRRTLYDHYMLQLHDRMKADENYQTAAEQMQVELPAGSSWIVQTDHVSHAAMAGQYVLEQTFYLPVSAMCNPELAPITILANALGQPLTA